MLEAWQKPGRRWARDGLSTADGEERRCLRGENRRLHARPRLSSRREFHPDAPDRLWWLASPAPSPLRGSSTWPSSSSFFSPGVVGWTMAAHLRTELVLDALAGKQRPPPSVIHPSGQGCPYTSFAFGQPGQQGKVRPSADSAEDCFDKRLDRRASPPSRKVGCSTVRTCTIINTPDKPFSRSSHLPASGARDANRARDKK